MSKGKGGRAGARSSVTGQAPQKEVASTPSPTLWELRYMPVRRLVDQPDESWQVVFQKVRSRRDFASLCDQVQALDAARPPFPDETLIQLPVIQDNGDANAPSLLANDHLIPPADSLALEKLPCVTVSQDVDPSPVLAELARAKRRVKDAAEAGHEYHSSLYEPDEPAWLA